ncbi:MAG: adenosylcobalamin-dependent ribonucleoside-diphosphate reductase [bacterium]
MTEKITKIIKRDGRVVPFEKKKLVAVIAKAGVGTGEFQEQEAKRLAEIVVVLIEKSLKENEFPQVEKVQDIVEQVLMAAQHFVTAKAYILYRQARSEQRRVERIIGVTDDLDLSINQLKVLESRYLLKDEEGRVIETPSAMFRRVARTLAAVEKNYKTSKTKRQQIEDDFYQVMSRFEFLPAGRTLNNAGTPQSQLASCFVLPIEDSMEGIFDAVKWMALVHQTGGGCIAAGSKVFTSFCGLENFEVLYERLGGKQAEIMDQNGWKIPLNTRNIRTLALDPSSGKYVQEILTDIRRYELPKERIYTIIAQGNLEVTTSDWHPFFVFENGSVVEKRADEITKGDLLVSTNPSITKDSWLFNKYQEFEGRKIDEQVGWLVGYILGDGSFGRAKTSSKKAGGNYIRLRLFDGVNDNLDKARHILQEITGEEITIQNDNRSETRYIATTNMKVVPWLQKLSEIVGPKGQDLHIPSIFIKSPLNVICAVLAGLLDSDGYVSNSRKRVDFATESPILADQIAGLLSLLGIHSAVREKKQRNNYWKLMYEIKLDNPDNLSLFYKYISPFMVHKEKLLRLNKHVNSSSRVVGIASPLLWENLEKYLIKIGVPVKSRAIHKSAIVIEGEKFWLNRLKWGGTLAIGTVAKLLTALLKFNKWTKEEKNILQMWLLAHQSFRPVIAIKKPNEGGEFYDFTTEKLHNYLAGSHGLTAVHNTGFNFSKLRPKGDAVTKSTGGFATGPISFMKVFDMATRQVMQGGKKRGANMGILNIDHPDILEFINCKNESGEIENFNLSVGMSDAFMRAVEKDGEWELKNPRTKETVQTMKARSLMSQVSAMAWRTGDPGLVFLDTINRNNPLKKSYGLIEATNPCGEQPLHPFDACNLGSINLAGHVVKVVDGKKAKREINYKQLEHTVRVGVRMLDNVVDACKYPLPQITSTVRANRRIGLGVLGWAEMLYQLRVPYNSKEGVELAAKVAKFIQDVSWNESEKLAKEKGVFPRWKESSFAKTGKKVRNMAITTIAPTGSISMLADCSSGIEPVFALVYTKNVLEEAGLSYINKYFREELETAVWADGDSEHKVRDRIVREVASAGSIKHVSGVPGEVSDVYQTAHDITPEWHVKMQAAWQKYTDNAVSKTINFPGTGTVEEVMQAYLQAWKSGCKGITIYRDGSKDGQILSVGSESAKASDRQIIQSKIRIETLKQRIARGSKKTVKNDVCPECEAKMVIEEGCAKCYGCGYSVCSG